MILEIVGIAFVLLQAIILVISVIGLTLAILGRSDKRLYQVICRALQ